MCAEFGVGTRGAVFIFKLLLSVMKTSCFSNKCIALPTESLVDKLQLQDFRGF